MLCRAVQLYDNDVDKVDVMLGLLSEQHLPGFIFGESIWSVFLLQVRPVCASYDRCALINHKDLPCCSRLEALLGLAIGWEKFKDMAFF